MMKQWLALAGLVVLLGGCASTELIDETAQPAALMPLEETQVFGIELAYQVGLGTRGVNQVQPVRTALSSIPSPLAPFAQGVQLFSYQGLNQFPTGRSTWMAYQAGGPVWQLDLVGEVQSNTRPNAQGIFYLGSSKGWVYGLNALTGERIWQLQLSSEVMALSEQAGVLFARTIDGYLSALNPKDGARLWIYSRELPNLSLRGVSQPLVLNERVYLGSDSGRLSVLDVKSGKLLADLSLATSTGFTDLARMSDIDAQPQRLEGNRVLVQVYQGQLLALDANTGRAVWEVPLSSSKQAWVESERDIYLVNEASEVVRMDARTGLVVWKNEQMRFRYLEQPILLKGVVYAADKSGFVHGWNAQTGELVARLNLGEVLQYPLAMDGEALLAVTRSGSFYRLSVKAKE